MLERLAKLIAAEGPLPVDRYMALCLHDPDEGYYATRPALGAAGDFITAPLVSQMFGELIGAWVLDLWDQMGRPAPWRLVEIGPGDGTLMSDLQRVLAARPQALANLEITLVETSAPLRAAQAARLTGVNWRSSLAEIPADAPTILIGNEFLDCLPIRQFVRHDGAWRERRVGWADGALTYVAGDPVPCAAEAPEGAVRETCPALAEVARQVDALLGPAGGAALFIDYGRDRPGFGDTLQALKGHTKIEALTQPGEADLTAHVDFPAFLTASRLETALAPQRDFLLRLGLRERAQRLAKASPDRIAVLERQVERLISPDQMGLLFKAACLHSPGLRPAGFA